MSDLERIFAEIYKQDKWYIRDRTKVSSQVDLNLLLSDFKKFMKGVGVLSMVDLGCGLGPWNQSIVDAVPNYIGVDIVESVVERNRELLGKPGVEFIYSDIIAYSIPTTDMILCRAVMFHLHENLVFGILNKIAESDVKWVAMTTFTAVDRVNRLDLKPGSFYPISLTNTPFLLPHPHKLIKEVEMNPPLYPDKCLGIWKIEDLVKWKLNYGKSPIQEGEQAQ